MGLEKKENEICKYSFFFLLTLVIWCSEGVAEVDGGHDDDDADAEVLPPIDDHVMEVESEEWVERHQVLKHWYRI